MKMMPVVLCKDCIHRGHYSSTGFVSYPDDVCPAHCPDSFYSYVPDEDFFCAFGEERPADNEGEEV